MGVAACGGRGFKGRAAASSDRPIGAAGCRQQHNHLSCQPPPPLPPVQSPDTPTALQSHACVRPCHRHLSRPPPPLHPCAQVFLHIRNPHGRGEWKGRYSDNWHGWAQEPALRQELITCAKDDGSFWMCMDDFAAHCQTLNCNPDQPVQDSGKPFKSQGRGPLPSPGSGPSPSPSPGPGPGPGPAGGGSTATCKKCGKAVALVTQLPPMYAQGLFGCDVCGRTHPAASGCYHCECGWDACRTCGGGGAPSPAPGPSPHPAPGPAPGGGGGRVGCGKCGRPLQVTTTLPAMYQQGVFSCDICKQLHFAANGVYHCDACQWDAGSVCAEIRG